MISRIYTLLFLFALTLFAASRMNAGTLPRKEKNVLLEGRLVKDVPPPVLAAYKALLEEIAANRGASVSDITGSKIYWKKEKDEYNLSAMYQFGICGEGGFVIILYATFKANGELLESTVYNAECTGRIEF